MASVASRPPPAQGGTMRFTNVRDLFNAIDYTARDSLTVRSIVSPCHFYIIRTRERQRRKFRFRYYDSDSRILIITIPTDSHEQLNKELYNDATRSVQQGYSGRRSKEGDSAGGPKPERATKGAWPTLVIEAGVSETLTQLRLDMRRWFDMSNYEVKIVLLAKFDGTKILLEKWEEEMRVRPGATTTRRSLQHQESVLRQSITITQDTTTDPTSYHVTSGALVPSFRFLFLREPGPGKGDFVIGVQELEEYAENIWSVY
ncbi:uncharacterized protein B0T15DRAFT_566349 [Chaetomium strumarium]|uniref:Uncharacterized protein n=1 Tax=Chaetomium strumarium TaxID=1170767 RepID=A0AAJ0GV91_9PEZI|nr:hypothetical protein B0T15DRAFT_566349 [Chaetomium strumarium]